MSPLSLQEWMDKNKIDPKQETYTEFIKKISMNSQLQRETSNLNNMIKAKDVLSNSIQISKRNDKFTNIIQSMSEMKNHLQSNNDKMNNLVVSDTCKGDLIECNSKLLKVVNLFSLQLEEAKKLSKTTKNLLNLKTEKKSLITKGVETSYNTSSTSLKSNYLTVIEGLKNQNQTMNSLLKCTKEYKEQESTQELTKWKNGYNEIVQFSREVLMELRDCEAELIQAYNLIKVKLEQDNKSEIKTTRNDAMKRKIQSTELALLSCMMFEDEA